MASVFTPTQMEVWESETQALLEEGSIVMDIANVRDMNGASTLHNPYDVRMKSSSYTAYSDVTDEDINYIADDLTSFSTRMVSFVYDPITQMDTEYNVVMGQTKNAAYTLSMDIERDFFAQYSNAGQASASTVTLSSTNTFTTFAEAKAALGNIGVNRDNLITVVDDYVAASVGNFVVTNGYQAGDTAIKRGYRGQLADMQMYLSSSLIASGSFTPANNLTDGETVTANGVVWTARAVPSLPGEFDIGASTAATIAILVNAINGSATGKDSATGYFEVSAADREKLYGIVATDGTTSLDITSRGYRAVSSSSTEWGQITINCLIMEKGAIDFAFKQKVKLVSQPVHKQLGTRYMTYTRYGLKTFVQNAKKIFNLKIQAQATGA